MTPATVPQIQTSGSSTFTMTDTNRDVAVHDLPRTCRWLNAAFDRWLMPTVRGVCGDGRMYLSHSAGGGCRRGSGRRA